MLNFLFMYVVCRPLSKTVRFNVFEVVPAGSTGGSGKKAFTAASASE
jgi:small subunit ribosomal protein S11e